ncbi:FG-GAP repeat domain-containing protein [Streptomyces genisteinicus]|nr:VCBS repeat-containing protein [Streptomyces genisteinicus]
MPVPLARPTRRRFAAVVTTVLAITLGATALTAPAHAAPAVRSALTTDTPTAADPVPYPRTDRLVGAGVTGFLTDPNSGPTTWFRRYADGAAQEYEGAVLLRSTATTDFLVTVGPKLITQRNLASDGSLEVPVGTLPGDAMWAGAAADAVFTSVTTEAGTVLRKHVAGAPATPVTGLPADATYVMATPATPDHALVRFTRNRLGAWGLLDLSTGVFTPGAAGMGARAVSTTHIASFVDSDTEGIAILVRDRATDAVTEVPERPQPLGALQVGLVGDWVVYGGKGGMGFVQPSIRHAITAYNVTTGATAKVLDHAYEFTSAPDGSLYARGGLVGRGEGVYRIAATGGDALTAVMVATTGEPTEVVTESFTAPPAELDLDRVDGFTFTWKLSRTVTQPKLTLRHARTGMTWQIPGWYSTREPEFSWSDIGANDWAHAPNGEYTWEMTAEPANGIGPDVTAGGTFAVVREAQPHDYNDNGSPDLLQVDSSGRLWRTDLVHRPYDAWPGVHESSPAISLGSGWGVYDRLEAAGDLAGTTVGDLLARDASGVLWLYQGKGDGNFSARVRIGGGWQVYDKITAGSDLTGDGRADALASDRSGVLWLYTATGDAAKPFLPRRQIGTGWGTHNDITAVGDIAGAAAGDLVARDTDGVLWLYLGKGDGTLAPRTRIGGGWNVFRALIGSGDADGDGRPDLMGLGVAYEASRLYRSNGDWKAPFRPGQAMHLSRIGLVSDTVF